MKSYLYRQSNASGVATHWSKTLLDNTNHDFDLLGFGEWIQGKDGMYLHSDYTPYSDDIQEITE